MRRFLVITCFVVVAVAASYAATTRSSNNVQPGLHDKPNGVTPTATPPPTPTPVPTPTPPPT